MSQGAVQDSDQLR